MSTVAPSESAGREDAPVTDETLAPASEAERPSPPGFLRQVGAHVRRNLIHIKRQPEMLTDVTIQPVMFVVLFGFVFGGAIAVTGGGNYREFLLPGIMAQTMTFSSFVVASGLCTDLNKGIIDRFRTLPIQRASILVGRSVSSIIHSSLGVLVMSVTGLLIGWTIRNGVVDAILGYLVLLGFGFAMIWIGILVGSRIKTIEAVNGVMFTTIFPITFVANTFVPPESMPTWLRHVAEWNPLSSVVQAMRELWGNAPPAGPETAWALQNPVLMSFVWIVAITLVIAPLALRAFDIRTRD